MPQTQHGRLIALRAPSSIDPKVDPPKRLVMLKWGDNPTTKGNFRVGKKTLEVLGANQRHAGFEEVVLDFEHNTVPNHPCNRGEPAAIAARGKPIVVENEGLIFDCLTWTEPGIQFREHYHDLSPVVAKDANDDVVFVLSGCVCRNGATYDLHAFNAQLDLKTFSLTPFTDPARIQPAPPVSASAVDLDLLRKVLNLSTTLSATATVEDINRALQQIDLDGIPETGLSADAAALLRALSVKVNGFETRFVDSERQAIVVSALNAGKVIPQEFLEGETKLGNAQLKVLVAGLPEIVPLSSRTPEKLREFAALQPRNPVRDSVQRQLGLDKAVFEKHNAE